jgi:hypothetical protein
MKTYIIRSAMEDNKDIIEIVVDTFDPKLGPKKISLNLKTATMKELEPYIDADLRIKEAYGRKFLDSLYKK